MADIQAEALEAIHEVGPVEQPISTGKPKKRLGFGFWIPAAWTALILFCALFGPFLPLKNPNVTDPCAQYVGPRVNLGFGNTQQSGIVNGVNTAKCTENSRASATPSWIHPLGTDSTGRDILARLVAGARVAMIAGVVTILIGLVVGGTIGLVAGYFRGRIEILLMALVDIMLAFPALVLALAIVAVIGRGLTNACIAITVVAIPIFARITRANTLAFADREFVTAARVMGAKHLRIMTREILPNVILPVISFAILAVAVAIVTEGALAFLSLSVKDPQASWGTMINDGHNVITASPWVVVPPSVTMLITVLCLNLLGEQFRRFYDVKDAAL